jgi:hypothetical protein
MNKEVRLRMHIKEIFRFQSGQTVFVGIVEEGPNYIPSSEVFLMIDGQVGQPVKLEGEMIPDQRNTDGFRSVSTKDEVGLTRPEILEHQCYLCSECIEKCV